MNRKQLEELRHVNYKVYGYKTAFCNGNDCCERCDAVVHFGCKLIKKIEDLQIKRILKICPEDTSMKKAICISIWERGPELIQVGKTYYLDMNKAWKDSDDDEYAPVYDIDKKNVGEFLTNHFKFI